MPMNAVCVLFECGRVVWSSRGHVDCPTCATPLPGWHNDFVRVAGLGLPSSHRKSERAEDHDSRQHATTSRGPPPGAYVSHLVVYSLRSEVFGSPSL